MTVLHASHRLCKEDGSPFSSLAGGEAAPRHRGPNSHSENGNGGRIVPTGTPRARGNFAIQERLLRRGPVFRGRLNSMYELLVGSQRLQQWSSVDLAI